MKLHEYFTELSKSIGFDETEAISLYDIPGIFGSLIGEENWPLLMPQTFIYSKCKDYYENMNNELNTYVNYYSSLDSLITADFDYSQSCLKKLDSYLHDSSGEYDFLKICRTQFSFILII